MTMHLFLAEDEPRLARSYRRNLEDEGHTVELATDGEEALKCLLDRFRLFDVIILDILLPRRDGIAICRELRRRGIHTPILLLTALDQTEEKVAGLDAGADDYLTKPFPFPELLARLRALARRAPDISSGEASQIIVGDLVIDLLRHEVTRGDTLIPLTAREFALLELLARHAGRVLRRRHLQVQIWPEGTEAGSNVLDTYIHYLRDKIDRAGEAPLIVTVRGVGYMLRNPGEGSQHAGAR